MGHAGKITRTSKIRAHDGYGGRLYGGRQGVSSLAHEMVDHGKDEYVRGDAASSIGAQHEP
jgi:hypothetical protein